MVKNETFVGCMSEQHHPSCPCLRCKPRDCENCHRWNIQHEIPEMIGKNILRMKGNELLENTHPESKICHTTNDWNVDLIYQDMLKTIKANGNIFTKEMVLTIRKM